MAASPTTGLRPDPAAPAPGPAADSRLIVAIDTPDRARASEWIARLRPACGLVKLGLEYFTANGPDAVRAEDPARLFLDLKLHDIPQTVFGAARAVREIGPAMLTVHAGGGAAMVARARDGLEPASGARPTLLLAVTVLTSLDPAALAAAGVSGGPRQQALRLGRLAIEAGADGLVCSPHEVRALRDLLGPGPVLVVPGIRPRGAAGDDQARVATPAEAVEAGADWVVVGRPITLAADPPAACRAIDDELRAAAR